MGRHAERPRLRWIDREMLRSSTSLLVDALWVGSYGEDRAARVLQRVEDALDLIRTHDPVRYHRLRGDLERVWVLPLNGSVALFDQTLLACHLDERFVLAETTTPEQIAAAIVHEATHARLMRAGIGYEEEIRARVEAVCLRREMAFAHCVPEGEGIREEAERTLALCSDPDYWTNTAFGARYAAAMRDTLMHLGMPAAVARATIVVFRSFAAMSRLLWQIRSVAGAIRVQSARSMRRITSSSCSSDL